jgi:hypothetical protein
VKIKLLMKINPFKNSNPMSWQDASKVSAVLSAAMVFTTFLPSYDFGTIVGESAKFGFELACFFGRCFFTDFISLAGLAQIVKQSNNNSNGGEKE